jgi:hypothetical protein
MVVMRKHRHDPSEIRRLLDVRQSEKLTYEQLSERSGVPVHVLTYRAAQDRGAQPDAATESVGFVEVVPAAEPMGEPEASTSFSGIELVLPGGARALLDRHFDEGTLARLLTVARC